MVTFMLVKGRTASSSPLSIVERTVQTCEWPDLANTHRLNIIHRERVRERPPPPPSGTAVEPDQVCACRCDVVVLGKVNIHR